MEGLDEEIVYQRARRILAQFAGWLADREEPPSLRDGYSCPTSDELDWARAVVTLRDRKDKEHARSLD